VMSAWSAGRPGSRKAMAHTLGKILAGPSAPRFGRDMRGGA
jgi:hypothetical protein